ncbi:hypothetical protein K3495_g52 [Podosphaera aphanis]|nr:hypothetical protein K3495_g52 [Podosphaera aphanis]
MSATGTLTVRHAYRHLYRGLLHAVQYSKPARYIARDELRTAFRKEDASNFDPLRVSRTIEFLGLAAKYAGMEHRMVKNILHTKYWIKNNAQYKPVTRIKDKAQRQLRSNAMAHYDRTIAMLNDSMNLCLR